jgi:hypothetical protein
MLLGQLMSHKTSHFAFDVQVPYTWMNLQIKGAKSLEYIDQSQCTNLNTAYIQF